MNTTVLTKTTPQLESLLHRMCTSIQLSPTQFSLAKEHYEAVANVLSEDEYFDNAHLDIYPQGSLRIGTTVKPLNRNEYDLDFVMEVTGLDEVKLRDPVQFLNDVTAILENHGTYKDMVKRKNRCVGLTYANDFHMDILPGRPTNGEHPNCIVVPDRKAEDWKASNPKGYAEWFDQKAADFHPYELTKALFEASSKIDPLPDLERVEHLPPLKRAVQLMKRHRDIVFENDADNAPISIVLTTLAGELYQKQGSVYDTLLGILEGIVERIRREGFIRVYNPKNGEELLSEKWESNPEMYEKFVSFITSFSTRWAKLPERVASAGHLELSEQLGTSFGSDLVKSSISKEAILQRRLQEAGFLKMQSTGIILPTAAATGILTGTVPIKANTFYGN